MSSQTTLLSDLVSTTEFHSVVSDEERKGTHTEALVDPATGDRWGGVTWSAELVDEAVRAADSTDRAGSWRTLTAVERADVLDGIGRRVGDHIDQIAALESLANGKPYAATRAEVAAAARWWQYCASLLRTLREERIQASATKEAAVTHEAIGVVGLITPFNGAFSLGTWKLAPALAAGNSVVVKPPLDSPGSSLLLHRIARDAGLPDGTLHIVQGGAETGRRLVEHPTVGMVSFTGSTGAAQHVGAAVSGRLGRFVAEAGGKSAHLVFDDASVEDAVTAVVQGGFSATGQTCVAGSRVLVQRGVAQRFTEALVERVSRLRLGNPAEDTTHLGPIATRQQYERVRSLVSQAREDGAEVLIGGTGAPDLPAPFDGGFWMSPTLLRVESNKAAICRTEVFGPVLTVLAFDTEQEALEIANDSDFGLAAGCWTTDMARARRVGQRLQAGTVWINTYRGMDWQTPFGGVKRSGVGRENGIEGFREFQQTKAVVQEFASAPDPFGLV